MNLHYEVRMHRVAKRLAACGLAERTLARNTVKQRRAAFDGYGVYADSRPERWRGPALRSLAAMRSHLAMVTGRA